MIPQSEGFTTKPTKEHERLSNRSDFVLFVLFVVKKALTSSEGKS